MASSLATQLAAIKAANVSVLDRKKRQKSHGVSLIFDPKVAVTQDYETIYGISLEAFRELCDIEPRFEIFNNSLFALSSIGIDRLVQTKQENIALDKAIGLFLELLAPRILLQPAIKALEWLVRRFRIHQHNAELLLVNFLPYYAHPIFIRILDIIPLPLPPLFSFLNNSKQQLHNPSRNLMIRALATDAELFSLVSQHIQHEIVNRRDYHALCAFWSSMTVSVIIYMKDQAKLGDEVIADRILPYIPDAISQRKSCEAQISGYMVVTVLAFQCRLAPSVLDATILTIASQWTKLSVKCGLVAIVQLISEYPDNDWTPSRLPKSVFESVDRFRAVNDEFLNSCLRLHASRFLSAWALSIITSSPNKLSSLLPLFTPSFFDLLSESDHNTILSTILDLDTHKTEIADFFSRLLSISDDCKRLITSCLSARSMTVDELELQLQVSLQLIAPDNHPSTNHEELTNGHHHQEALSKTSVSEQLAQIATKTDSSLTTFLSGHATDIFNQLTPVFFACLNSEKHVDRFLQLPIFHNDDGIKITFLIRVWTNSHYPALAKSAAVRICCSIMLTKDNNSIDYQVLIPHLLIAMADSSMAVRRAATDTFYQLSTRYNSTNLTAMFGLDTVYGPTESNLLRWMAPSDLEPFFHTLSPRLEEINLDGNVIGTLFGKYLDENHKGKSKSNLALLDFVSAHVFACPILEVKVSLLHLINFAEKPAKSKSSIFAPLLEAWPHNAPALQVQGGLSYLRQLIGLVSLGGKDGSIKFLYRVVDSGEPQAYKLACDKIVTIFPSLKVNIQLNIVEKFIDQVLESKRPVEAMETLNSLELSTQLLDGLLKKCRIEDSAVGPINQSPGTPGGEEENGTRNTGRKRRASSNSSSRLFKDNTLADIIDKYVQRLSIVLEILESHKPETHPTLLPRVFTLLGDLTSLRVESKISISYTLQLFASCMLNMIKNVDSFNDVGVDANNVRVDILVNCIRMSNSIQVQNRFLLVLAALAPLVPELVLHSVMPVFTFMGASTLRQDDAFSAHVVDQTISRIIPAMLQSQETANNNNNNNKNEGLILLLLSFVTAFPHIPRHRRVQLFSSLAKSIGSDHIYLLICLIGGKYYEMKVKSKINEYRAYSSFVTAFMSTLPILTRLQVICNILKLTSEIPLQEIPQEPQNDNSNKQLYEILWDLSDYTSAQLEAFRVAQLDLVCRSILTEDLRRKLLIGFDSATKAHDSAKCDDIKQLFTSSLEQVLTTMSDSTIRSKQVLLDEYYLVLDGLISTLPITQFVDFFKSLMSSPDPKVQTRSLSLVSSKFSLEPSGDSTSCAAALEVLPILVTNLEDQSTTPETRQLILNGLEVLISKYASTSPSEYTKLFAAVSGDGGLAHPSPDVNISAMLCLSALSSCLGARILPYLGKIMPLIISKAHQAFDSNDEMLEIGDFALLECFIRRIPAFMGSYTTQIMKVMLQSCGQDKPFNSDIQNARNLVASTISNHISPKKVFDGLSKTWSDAVNNGYKAQDLHIDIFEKTLQVADRKTVAAHAQALVAFCLELFDLRNQRNQLDVDGDQLLNRIEARCISVLMHLVMKLNDKVFRPLFHQIVSWALESHSDARMYTFFRFLCRMLKQLKTIVTSYYGYLVDPVADMLLQWSQPKSSNGKLLRHSVLESLTLSFRNDETEFWQLAARFDRMMDPIIQQLNTMTVKENPVLIRCIVAFAQACPSEEQRKAINDAILNHMKGDRPSEMKICAIQVLRGIYAKLGEEWLSMLPQLVPIVAELLEDEDEDVEMEVRRKLVPVIEQVLGESLDRYLS